MAERLPTATRHGILNIDCNDKSLIIVIATTLPAEARLHPEDGLGDGGEEAEVGADEGAPEELGHVEGEEVGVERQQLEGEVARVHHLRQALLLDQGAQGCQALIGGKEQVHF